MGEKIGSGLHREGASRDLTHLAVKYSKVEQSEGRLGQSGIAS